MNGLLSAVMATLLVAADPAVPTPVGLPSAPPLAVAGVPTTPVLPEVVETSAAPPGAALPIWISADYLFAWMQGGSLPPLVTTSPAGTPRTSAGIIGQSGTTVLIQGTVNESMRSGFRIEGGGCLDHGLGFGVEAGVSMIGSQAAGLSASSDGSTILARPFINALNARPDAVLLAFPGDAAGDVTVRAYSGNFYEAHLTFSEAVCTGGGAHIEALLGYRFYCYDESLQSTQTLRPLGADGLAVVTRDRFSAKNEFHGLDFGVRSRLGGDNLSLDLLAKVAVGQLWRRFDVKGVQEQVIAGQPSVITQGGIYALSSNIGAQVRNDWAAMPELGATLSYRLNPNMLFRAGYSLMFLGGIARATDTLDTTINPNLFPPATPPVVGPSAPAPLVAREDIWIQALSLGLEFTY